MKLANITMSVFLAINLAFCTAGGKEIDPSLDLAEKDHISIIEQNIEPLQKGIWQGKEVAFENRNGIAIKDGDLAFAKVAADGTLVDFDASDDAEEENYGTPLPGDLKYSDEEVEAAMQGFYLAETYPVTNHLNIAQDKNQLVAQGIKRYVWGWDVRWYKKTVPYAYDSNISTARKQLIRQAMNEWEAVSGVKFVYRKSKFKYRAWKYMFFTKGGRNEGCHAPVGRKAFLKKHKVYLEYTWDATRKYNCFKKGIILHEIAHVLGMWHEQSRCDRNNYVTINWNNIKTEQKHNFDRHCSDGTDLGSYDYDSIMHYGKYSFSKNGKPTIVPKQAGVSIGQRSKLSIKDIWSMQQLYGP